MLVEFCFFSALTNPIKKFFLHITILSHDCTIVYCLEDPLNDLIMKHETRHYLKKIVVFKVCQDGMGLRNGFVTRVK